MCSPEGLQAAPGMAGRKVRTPSLQQQLSGSVVPADSSPCGFGQVLLLVWKRRAWDGWLRFLIHSPPSGIAGGCLDWAFLMLFHQRAPNPSSCQVGSLKKGWFWDVSSEEVMSESCVCGFVWKQLGVRVCMCLPAAPEFFPNCLHLLPSPLPCRVHLQLFAASLAQL